MYGLLLESVTSKLANLEAEENKEIRTKALNFRVTVKPLEYNPPNGPTSVLRVIFEFYCTRNRWGFIMKF